MTYLSPRCVVHIQLESPLTTLARRSDGRGVYAVFWVGDVPLGHEYFDAGELPIHARDLEVVASESVASAVGRHLFAELIGERVGGDRGSTSALPPDFDAVAGTTAPLRRLQDLRHDAGSRPSVSVVVLSGDNQEGLERCLRSVRQSTVRPREIVVVDMGTDGAARASLPATTGEVLAFTDDRSTVHPRWVATLGAAFQSRNVMAAIGLVLPAELETEAQVAFERLLGGLNLGFEPRKYDEQNAGHPADFLLPLEKLYAPANFAVRSTWLRELRLGGTEWHPTFALAAWLKLWHEALACGREGRYEPTGVVFRQHPREEADVRREAGRRLSDLGACLATHFTHGNHPGPIRATLLSIRSRLMPRAIRTMAFGSTLERGLLRAELAGCLSGVRAFAPSVAAQLRWRSSSRTAVNAPPCGGDQSQRTSDRSSATAKR